MTLRLSTLHLLFAFLNQDERESYLAFSCQHCQFFVEQRQKARKRLSIKWISISTLTSVVWLVIMGISYDNTYISDNTVLILSIVYVIGWLIGSYLWVRRFEINIRQQYKLNKTSFAPDLVINDLKVFPVGFTLSQERGKFQMTANVRDVDYLYQLIEANQADCKIQYNHTQLRKLEQVRSSRNQQEPITEAMFKLLGFSRSHTTE